MTHPTIASELFKTAYESRYTWDENFPGYSADVQLVQGDEVYTGEIRINRDLSVEVTGVEDEQIHEGIYIQLRDLVTHRQRLSFEQSHGKHEFILGETDETGAVSIQLKDDIASNYKIRGKDICQVSRVMGRMAFVIDTIESMDTGSGYIATSYDATFRDVNSNKVTSVIKFEDTYEKLGDYYVMTKQILQEYQNDTRTTTEFSYSNIKLLEPAAV